MYEQTYHSSNGRLESTGTRQASFANAPALARERELYEGEQFFSVREASQIIWRRLWMIVLVALVFVGTSVGFSLIQTPVYGASVKLLVGQEPGSDQQVNLAGSVDGLAQLTQTMVQAIDSRPVAEEVIRRQGLQTSPANLLGNLTVEQIENTQFIQLYYEDSDPRRAQSVVNAFADVSSERIAEASAGANNLTATVWERAVVPNAPVSPDPVKAGLIALALGLLLGLGLAFLLEYLDDSWRSPEEVERASGVPTFGVVPMFNAAKSNRKGNQ